MIFPSYTSSSSLISLILATLVIAMVLGTGKGDKFDHADQNHDGLLDRQEYDTLIHELKETLDPFLLTVHEKTINNAIPEVGSATQWFTSLFHGSMAEDFMSGVINSLVVIWVTEIGDKTFFIAAVLAMRNGRTIVYLGCMGKLYFLS